MRRTDYQIIFHELTLDLLMSEAGDLRLYGRLYYSEQTARKKFLLEKLYKKYKKTKIYQKGMLFLTTNRKSCKVGPGQGKPKSYKVFDLAFEDKRLEVVFDFDGGVLEDKQHKAL